MTTATATTTPQINDLINSMRKNNRAARAARFFGQFFDAVCQTTDVIFIFEVLRTTRALSSKSFILCLCMKTIRAYFVQLDQLGIIAEHLTLRKVQF